MKITEAMFWGKYYPFANQKKAPKDTNDDENKEPPTLEEMQKAYISYAAKTKECIKKD